MGATGVAGAVTEYTVPTASATPTGITVGPDGALWFTEAKKIGRITTSGTFSEFPLAADVTPGAITTGADGALWFTSVTGSTSAAIGRMTTSGVVSLTTVPTATPGLFAITSGPDGALWFTESTGNKIGRVTTEGALSEFTLPFANDDPHGIAQGPDGELWFDEYYGNNIGKITTAGVITEYVIPTAASYPVGLTLGPDGNLRFVESVTNKVAKVTTTGTFTEYPIPTSSSGASMIAAGPDDALWFVEAGGTECSGSSDDRCADQVGRVTTTGSFTEYPAALGNTCMESSCSFSASSIVTGPDCALWYTQPLTNKIARMVP